MPNLWTDPEHALRYLAVADAIPHRVEGERVVLELLAQQTDLCRVLDLGTGDGRLTALVLSAHPTVEFVACDFAQHMVEHARARFTGVDQVVIHTHDLNDALPDWGSFDAVVSSFAIHHVDDGRKKSLYAEIAAALRPGGTFLNLEHVRSRSSAGHDEWLRAMNIAPEDDDPSNKLAPVPDQLLWLDEAGLVNADCWWKWRELALLGAWKPPRS